MLWIGVLKIPNILTLAPCGGCEMRQFRDEIFFAKYLYSSFTRKQQRYIFLAVNNGDNHIYVVNTYVQYKSDHELEQGWVWTLGPTP